MGKVSCFKLWALSILVLGSWSSYSAVAPSSSDIGDLDLPAEIFPLTQEPEVEESPMRSEAPSYQSEREWLDLREKILSDSGNRISTAFLVPDGLKQRTQFWFDIYARWGRAHHVVHHARYPWIVFRVIDTTQMLVNGKGPTWLRQDRANKLAKKQTAEIRAALKKLSKRKDYTRLSPLERELFNKLLPVKGKRQKVFAVAAKEMRSQLGQRDYFQGGLVNSTRYLPYMEDEFRALGLPTELTRLPFVESSFNEKAYSKVGASGIWQIMPRTGKSYMIVSDKIDERNSPLKATVAAGRLLREYHRGVGRDWALAVTSYNSGIGNVLKAVKGAKSRDLATVIERYQKGGFKFASSNFFTCFLAALYAEKYNELLFKEIPRQPLQEREVLKIAGRTHLKYLPKITGLDLKEILKYNLDLRVARNGNVTLPRGFMLHLPPGYKARVQRDVGTQDAKSKPNT